MSVALSVVVPAYNAEEYLESCIQSIMSGVYTDFEVLLIDDGSTDRTAALCDSLQQKYPQIKVFHTENQGLPSARNLGIESAEGRYIGFVDADDLVSQNMFKTLVYAMEPDIQLVACQYQRCFRSSVHFNDEESLQCQIADQAGTAEQILRGAYGPYVWNKLYRKEILDANNIRFLADCQGAEDQFFNAAYLQHCAKTAFLNQKLYCYITTDGSITSTFRTSKTVNSCYISLPRSWRFTAEIMENISEELMEWSQAKASMFYQTVLRKVRHPDVAYIQETINYVKQNRTALLHYRWGYKYYLSALLLDVSDRLWALVFRRGV